MAELLRTVVILAANPALSSLLVATLSGTSRLRARGFASAQGLTAYLNLVPADCVVLDLDEQATTPFAAAGQLRRRQASLPLIGLATQLSAPLKQAAGHAGISELIVKPMSPRYLVERVLAHLEARAPLQRPRRLLPVTDWSAYGDNIVPLRTGLTSYQLPPG